MLSFSIIRARLFHALLLPLPLVVTGCAAEVLRAPSIDDNRLYAVCTSQLLTTYRAMEAHKEAIPAPIQQKVTSLLLAAEIDGQFKHYPTCVDKLTRARLFLKQAKVDTPRPTFPSGEDKIGAP